jgi:dTMP kinase
VEGRPVNRGNGYDGTLIAVEGIDGCGKSTVVRGIAAWADEADREVVVSKEPTDLWTGEQVYRALKDDDTPPLADFSLFVADRVKHVHERIEPALKAGKVVVTDRYADSTRAYQTHRIAEQMDMEYREARQWMEDVFGPWNIEADITIYIDIPVDTAMERCGVDDKYERRDNLEQVKEAYDRMYDRCDGAVRVIDGLRSKSAVRHTAINTVKTALRGDDIDYGEPGQTYADAIGEDT